MVDTIQLPGIWLAVGDAKRQGHPLMWCEKGDGNDSGYVRIGWITKAGYSVACDAAQAYNDQRNAERDTVK